MTGWSTRRGDRTRLLAKLRRRLESHVRLRRRLDVTLLVLAGLFIVVLAFGGYALATYQTVHGPFDNPPLGPIPDRRILTNLRDGPPARRFNDMALLPAKHALFVARAGGRVHRFDLDTELWHDESYRPANGGITSDVVALRGACGNTGVAAHDNCAAPATLWAVTENGGLLRRDDGVWRTVIGDSRFVGLDGKPVSQADLSSIGLSQDGQWLLLGTKNQGIGLFHIRGSRWVAIARDRQRMLIGELTSPVGVSHVVWQDGRFWIGGGAGLGWLLPDEADIQTGRVKDVAGDVLDLDRTVDGRLLALSVEACMNAGGKGVGCLQLHQINGAENVARLVGEVERHTGLSSETVFYAAARSGAVIALGKQGVYAYEPAKRAWRQLDNRGVTAYWESSSDGSLYYAVPEAVVRLRELQKTKEWALAGENIVQLLPGSGADTLAFTRAGKVYSLGQDKTALFTRGASAVDPASLHGVAASGERLLLTSPGGVVLHDAVRRTYDNVPGPSVPAILRAPRTRLMSSGTDIWAIKQSGQWADFSQIDIQHKGGKTTLAETDGASAPAPLRDLRADRGGLMAIGRDGIAYRIALVGNRSQAAALIGNPPAGLMRNPVGAALLDGTLAVADPNGVWAYDMAKRTWSKRMAVDLAGQKIADIASDGNILYVLGTDGLLVVWVPGPARPRNLVGHGPPLPFSASDLSDATLAGGSIYLAGDGQVAVYDQDQRKLTRIWRLGPRSNIQLAGVVDEAPVGLIGENAYIGETSLTLPNAAVLGVALHQDRIVTVQRRGKTNFLAIYPARNDVKLSFAQCLFAQPAPRGRLLRDARLLPDGRIASLTDRGLSVYDPAVRRWHDAKDVRTGPNHRLFQLGEYLVQSDGQNLHAIKLADFPSSNSCATGAIKVPQTDYAARQVGISETMQAALLLWRNGAVDEWQGATGQAERKLPPVGTGPAPGTLRRAYRDGDALVFATFDGIWRYETTARSWQFSRLSGAPDRVSEIDLAPLDDGLFAVTVWDHKGASYGGISKPSKQIVPLKPLRGLNLPPVRWQPSELVDVAQLDKSTWLFLLENQLIALDAAAGEWRAILHLPGSRRDRRLEIWRGLITIAEGPPDNPVNFYFLMQTDDLKKTGAIDLASATFQYRRTAGERFAVIEKQVLLRIDKAGVPFSCDMKPGASAPVDCKALDSAPVALQPDRLVAAFEHGFRRDIVITRDGASLLNRAARRITPLGGEAARIASKPKAAYSIHGATWLLMRDGRLFTIDRDGESSLLSQHAKEIYDLQSDVIWVATAAGLRLHRSGTLLGRRASLEQSIGDAPPGRVRLLSLRQNGLLFALYADRRLVHQPFGQATEIDDLLTLPEAPALNDPRAVMRGTIPIERKDVDGWWVQDGRKLMFVHRVTCAVAPPTDTAAPPVWLRMPPKPCAKVALSVDLPVAPDGTIQPIRRIGKLGGERIIRFDQAELILTLRDGTTRVSRSYLGAPISPPPRRAEITAQLRAAITELVPGEARLDAPTLKAVDDNILLDGLPSFARASGTMAGQPVPPLDAGWLGWVRDSRQFRLLGTDRSLMLKPAEFIRDGRFLPMLPGRSVLLDADTIVVANRHGLWRYDGSSKAASTGPSYANVALPGPIVGLAHGRFLSNNGGVDAQQRAIVSDNDRWQFSFEDLTVTEALRSRKVSATLLVSGRKTPAFGKAGFRFDERLSVAWSQNQRLLLTGIGIGPIDRLSGFFATPPATAATTSLWSLNGPLHAVVDGAAWFRREGTNWVSVRDPSRNWTMVDQDTWRWESRNGSTQISAPQDAFLWRVKRDGLSFDSDRLIAATADPDRIVVVTQSGTHVAADPEALAADAPPVVPAPFRRGRLETVIAVPNKSIIIAKGGSGLARWNAIAGQWDTLNSKQNPNRQRRAVDTGLLRIVFRNGRPTSLVSMQPLSNGRRHWSSFKWRRGEHFPFDHATALYAVNDGRLFVGTRLGLRRFNKGPAGALRAIDIVDLRRRAGDPAPLVNTVGRPLDAPARLLARAGKLCAVLNGGGLARCNDPQSLDRRLLQKNDFWQWTFDRGVIGRYLGRVGRPLGPTLRGPFSRHLPHDRLLSLAGCQGRSFSLWRSGIVARHPGSDIPLQSPVWLWDRRVLQPEALYCVTAAADLGGTVLPAGAYLLGKHGTERFDGQKWSPVGAALAAGVRARHNGEVPFERGRLRVVNRTGKPPVFELRDRADHWRALPWQGRTLAIDSWQALTAAHGQVWAATPVGMVAFQQTPADLRLDLAQAITVALPSGPNGRCAVELVETLDGRVAHLARSPGTPTRLRCLDGSVLQGRLDGNADRGVLTPLTGSDPFRTRTLVDVDGFWTWRLIDRAPGTQGALAVRLRDEPLALSAGRFDIDDFKALASFDQKFDELLTGKGWIRAPGGRMNLRDVARWRGGAVDPRAVVGLTTDRAGATDPLALCLRFANKAVSIGRVGDRNQIAQCQSFLGFDGVWTYRGQGDRLIATATGRAGSIGERTLVEGGFDDVNAIGLPISRKDATGIEIFVPTRTGTSIFGEKTDLKDVIFSENPSRALTLASDGSVVAVAANGIDWLQGQPRPFCAGLTRFLANTGSEVTIHRIERRALDRIEVGYGDGDGTGQALVECGERAGWNSWAQLGTVASRSRWIGNRARWPLAGNQLLVELRGNVVHIRDEHLSKPVLKLPPVGQVLRLTMATNRVFLLTKDELYVGEIDALLSHLNTPSATDWTDDPNARAGETK